MGLKTTVILKTNIYLKLRQTVKQNHPIKSNDPHLNLTAPGFPGGVNDTIKSIMENIGKNNKTNDDHSMEIDTETRLIRTTIRKVTESVEGYSTHKKRARSEGQETNGNLKEENNTLDQYQYNNKVPFGV